MLERVTTTDPFRGKPQYLEIALNATVWGQRNGLVLKLTHIVIYSLAP
jgi:hypothetical protein